MIMPEASRSGKARVAREACEPFALQAFSAKRNGRKGLYQRVLHYRSETDAETFCTINEGGYGARLSGRFRSLGRDDDSESGARQMAHPNSPFPGTWFSSSLIPSGSSNSSE